MKEIKKAMRSLLNTILDWLAANRLTLNAKKTEIVLFRSKSKLCDTRFTIKIKGHKIYPSNKVKYLGVFLDPHLEWKHQVTELAKKLSIAVGLLSKIRHYVDPTTLRSLYFSLFHSSLSYGCMVWGIANKMVLDKISRLQKRAIRIITFSDYKEPTSPLFKKLGIIKIRDVIKLKQYEFIHDWKNNKLPCVFHNYFAYHETEKSTRLAKATQLIIPQVRTERYGSICMKHQGARIHNQLITAGFKLNLSSCVFKKEMKAIIIAAYD